MTLINHLNSAIAEHKENIRIATERRDSFNGQGQALHQAANVVCNQAIPKRREECRENRHKAGDQQREFYRLRDAQQSIINQNQAAINSKREQIKNIQEVEIQLAKEGLTADAVVQRETIAAQAEAQAKVMKSSAEADRASKFTLVYVAIGLVATAIVSYIVWNKYIK